MNIVHQKADNFPFTQAKDLGRQPQCLLTELIYAHNIACLVGVYCLTYLEQKGFNTCDSCIMGTALCGQFYLYIITHL